MLENRECRSRISKLHVGYSMRDATAAIANQFQHRVEVGTFTFDGKSRLASASKYIPWFTLQCVQNASMPSLLGSSRQHVSDVSRPEIRDTLKS